MKPLKPLKLLSLVALMGVLSLRADTILSFGSASPTAGLFKASGHAADEIVVEDVVDALKVRAPNFWTLQATGAGVYVDLSKAKPEDFLAIEVKGAISDNLPFLRVILFSPDWSTKSEWIFDLAGINPDTFTVVRAKTALGAPVNAADPQRLDLRGPVGAVQILAGAESGNRSWRVEVNSLQTAKP